MRNKLKRFEDLNRFSNVIENLVYDKPVLYWDRNTPIDLKSQWNSKFFGRDKPLVLELACGRGEYTVQLAKDYPDKNFIGVDIKGARIWKGAHYALENNMKNVGFLRARIESIHKFFGKNEVDEIWITFPDPFTRESKENKRLTSKRFLELYKMILKPSSPIHLKTDDDGLYHFTLEVLYSLNIVPIYHSADIYSGSLYTPELAYKTYYEMQHLAAGKTIKYIQFRWP